MAHYAFLNENNIVVEVITGQDEGTDGINWEEYYSQLRGLVCKRTSYNTAGGQHLGGGDQFRKNYAGQGMYYDPVRDAFIAPQPYPSWTLNEDTCRWEPPDPFPEQGTGQWMWDENTTSWVPA